MKRIVKPVLYALIAVLMMQVIKVLLARHPFTGSYFTATLLGSSQFLIVFFVLIRMIFSGIANLLKIRPGTFFNSIMAIAFMSFLEIISWLLLNNPDKIPQAFLRSFQYYYDYNCELVQFKRGASLYNADFFYTLKPGAVFEYRQNEFRDSFRINEKGFRDDDPSLQAPYIVCLGDSYTMGWGVSQEENYASQLEQLTGLRTLNMGTSSYGTAREILRTREVDSTGRKFVIIQYCSNDLGENKSFVTNNYQLEISAQKEFDYRVKAQELSLIYFPGKIFSTWFPVFIKNSVNRIKPVFDLTFERENTVAHVDEHALYFIKTLAHSGLDFRKVKVIVTMMDSKYRKGGDVLKSIDSLVNSSDYRPVFLNNVKTLDISSLLGEKDYYILDLHYRASAHRKIAEQLAETIKNFQ